MALDSIPFLGGYQTMDAINRAKEAQQIQQAGQFATLQSVLQQSQRANQQMQREQQFRNELAALGPNPNQEALAVVASKYGSPDKVMDVQQRSLDRQNSLEERKAMATERLEAALQSTRERIQGQIEAARQRGADQRAIAEMMINGRKEIAQVAAGLRQPPQPQMVTNNDGVFQVGRDGIAKPVTDADGKPLTGKPQEKALPTTAAQKLFENQQNLKRAEDALGLIQGKNVGPGLGDKNATGIKGFLPDSVLQRIDPDGVDTRAAIADLGSLVIHDRSGAAVTASEYPRLAPFIPTSKDDPDAVIKKLRRFKGIYQSIVDDTRAFYKESGYKIPDLKSAPAQEDRRTEPRGDSKRVVVDF